jgi:aminoglycoside phosphotransferase (APT) family kinase protein
MLTYIDGDTVGWSLPWPEWVRSTDLLQEVGAAVAQMHHAAESFPVPPDAIWQSGVGGPEGSAVICHNDIAPYNIVAADGHLAGIIDWDQAGPGDPLSDLAFAAWQWVPLHGPFVASLMGWSDPDRAGRLRLLLDAYGLESRGGFIDAVIARIHHNRATMLARAAAGDPAYQALVDQGHIGGMDEALSFVRAERAALERDLL